jgi:hypothetical protein
MNDRLYLTKKDMDKAFKLGIGFEYCIAMFGMICGVWIFIYESLKRLVYKK